MLIFSIEDSLASAPKVSKTQFGGKNPRNEILKVSFPPYGQGSLPLKAWNIYETLLSSWAIPRYLFASQRVTFLIPIYLFDLLPKYDVFQFQNTAPTYKKPFNLSSWELK